MTAVSLEVRQGAEGEPHNVRLDVDDDERARLELFSKNVTRLQATQIFAAGFPALTSIRFSQAEGMQFEVTPFDYAHVCEFLHVARPVFLKSEPASFLNVQAYFGKAGAGTPLAKFMRY